MATHLGQRVAVGLLAVALVLSLGPGVAAAQSGVGGTVVIEEGETVSGIDAVTGNIVVEGTVTGDVSGVAGDVNIDGTVEGDVEVAAGNLRIGGRVGGDVSAGAGNVHLQEGGTVAGDFEVGAGSVRIDGTIDGDATVGADVIRLGESAAVAGLLRYDGTLEGNRDAVAGEVVRDSTIGAGVVPALEPLGSWLFTAYAFVLNFLLGAALLGLFPRFSRGIADRVSTEPARTGLVGLGVLIGIPLALVALAITIVLLPLSLVGGLAFAFVAWIGLVYGRFAVGAWLLSLADVESPWAALVVGLLVGAGLSWVPIVGGLLNLVIFLLGLGALSRGLYAHQRRQRDSPTSEPVGESTAD